MTLPVPDIPLLAKVVSYIDANPHEWAQRTYLVRHSWQHCGTFGCVAGHTALMAGDTPVWEAGTATSTMVCRRSDTGRVQYVSGRAIELLGITDDEAGALFHARNTRADIQDVATQIAARAGVTWDVPLPEWAQA